MESLCCFDSDTSWTVFYHVNNIDLTAHPNEEGFSLLWDGIRFLSHRHTITVSFPQHSRQSHRNETNPCHLYYQERANKRMKLHQKKHGSGTHGTLQRYINTWEMKRGEWGRSAQCITWSPAADGAYISIAKGAFKVTWSSPKFTFWFSISQGVNCKYFVLSKQIALN